VTFDGRVVTYPFGELDELVLCYATTIHKSQGSEYPVVVIPISTQHYMMLKRNLIYTGITRGKRLVVLVGQKRALAMAVKGKQVERRWSKLKERLVGQSAGFPSALGLRGWPRGILGCLIRGRTNVLNACGSIDTDA
jgi:ATP-dependent exoDNAse (exonuclease V) alpha subunit